jgi:hypothetical protein
MGGLQSEERALGAETPRVLGNAVDARLKSWGLSH